MEKLSHESLCYWTRIIKSVIFVAWKYFSCLWRLQLKLSKFNFNLPFSWFDYFLKTPNLIVPFCFVAGFSSSSLHMRSCKAKKSTICVTLLYKFFALSCSVWFCWLASTQSLWRSATWRSSLSNKLHELPKTQLYRSYRSAIFAATS